MTNLGHLSADDHVFIVCPNCSGRNLLLKEVDSTTLVKDESVRTPVSLVYNCDACDSDHMLSICSVDLEEAGKGEIVHWHLPKG